MISLSGTVYAKDGESYTFKLSDLLTEELGIGTHYFRVTEQAGNTAGMAYDSSRGMFRVELTDSNADGVLEVTVEDVANTQVRTDAGVVVEKDFNNVYDVAKTFVDINIQKELINNTGVNIPWNSFHFVLVNKANPEESYTVTTDAAGKATIRIPELDEGEYEYELREVEDAAWLGMDFDSDPRTVTVSVTKAGQVLQAVTKINGVESNNATFQNTYSLTGTDHTIRGTKKLNGRDLKDGEFTFVLYETDASFALQSNAQPKETVTNIGNSFSFSQINYTKVGTYYYSVREVSSGKAGVTYDTTHYHITVTVTVDGAALKKDVTINKIGHNDDNSGDIVFINGYTAKPTEYTISGTKVLYGRALAAGEFTFALYEGDVKKGETTNKADGSFTFDTISYYKPGTYTYTVKELKPAQNEKAPGVTYTDAVVEVIVTVTDTDAVLSAVANKTPAQIVLENTYTAADAKVIFNGTKTFQGGDLTDNSFTFHLYETDHTFSLEGFTPKETVQNTGAAFAFNEIFFHTAGTYFYAVVEDATDPIEGVVYDSTQHNYVVQVRDLGDGQLRAEVTNVTTGVSGEAGASVNASADFVNATFDQVAEKEVYIANSSTQVDGEKVNPGDVLTYWITYTNYTGKAVVVDITDTIPEYTSYVEGSASHNATYAGTHLTWILNVAKDESVTVSFDVKVEEAEAVFTNTAVIRDGVNTYTTNEVLSHTVENELKKDVFFSEDPAVSINGQTVHAGDELLYQISFTNASADMVDVQIKDRIPANTTYVQGSADNGGVYANGEIVWEIADVEAWSSVTVTFKVTVNAVEKTATIVNEAMANDGNSNLTSEKVTNTIEVVLDPNTPQTGDDFNAILFIGLMVISSFGIAAVMVCKKREEERETA